jgi:hypothetical protein
MEKIPVSGRNGFIPSHHYAAPWDCLEKERLLEEWPGGTSAFGPIMAFWFLVMAFLGFGDRTPSDSSIRLRAPGWLICAGAVRAAF